MRAFVTILRVLVAVGLSLLGLEYALRTVRSLTRYGVLHLSSPSADIQPHPKYGWISPSSRRVEKSTECYGRGWITYNEGGFRAPPMEQAGDADVVVCVLGDSSLHGFQIPDGKHLPHLLENRLLQLYERPFVLPLAVGGYGSVQEWMLFEDYCRVLQPAVVIQHWSANDVLNNSYRAERYSGPVNNNVRPRPYLERGQLTIRRPYPVRVSDSVDSLLLARVINSLILRWDARPKLTIQGLEQGWEVAEEMTRRLSEATPAKIALIEETEEKAIEMFRRHGFRLAIHEPFSAEEVCLPDDPHPNSKGHLRLLAALWPVVDGLFGETAVPNEMSPQMRQSGAEDGGVVRLRSESESS